jgi:hypothetical protein
MKGGVMMAIVSLKLFTCPACNDGTMIRIEIDEDAIKKAPRLPAAITTTCSKNHSLVVFVDGNFQVRDVEVAMQSQDGKKDAVEKAGDWFSSL